MNKWRKIFWIWCMVGVLQLCFKQAPTAPVVAMVICIAVDDILSVLKEIHVKQVSK